jgi:hypothetical protein
MAILFCKTTKEFQVMLDEAQIVHESLARSDEAVKQGNRGPVATHEEILASEETPDWIKTALDIGFNIDNCEGMDINAPLFFMGKGVTKRM